MEIKFEKNLVYLMLMNFQYYTFFETSISIFFIILWLSFFVLFISLHILTLYLNTLLQHCNKYGFEPWELRYWIDFYSRKHLLICLNLAVPGLILVWIYFQGHWQREAHSWKLSWILKTKRVRWWIVFSLINKLNLPSN